VPGAATEMYWARLVPVNSLSSGRGGERHRDAPSKRVSELPAVRCVPSRGCAQEKTPPQVGPGGAFDGRFAEEGSPGHRTERRRQDDTPKRKMVRAWFTEHRERAVGFDVVFASQVPCACEYGHEKAAIRRPHLLAKRARDPRRRVVRRGRDVEEARELPAPSEGHRCVDRHRRGADHENNKGAAFCCVGACLVGSKRSIACWLLMS
jgi:hypothetical protein